MPRSSLWLVRTRAAIYFILALGVALSILAFRYSAESIKEKERLRFDIVTKQAAMLVKNRMDAYKQTLYAGSGLFDSSVSVERNEWRDFVKTLRIDKNFSGIQGLGFAEVVYPNKKNEHISKIRKEGFADYSIRPDGERDIYTPIIYLEPFNDRNKRAFGYDMFSEQTRREAMVRAVVSGEAATSRKVRLVQENNIDEQAGFLTYAPVYHKGMPIQTKEERMAAIKGFVYAPFRMKDLMSGVLGSKYENIDLEIYDGEEIDSRNLLFDTHEKHDATSFMSEEVQLDINGQIWTLYFKSLKGFDSEVSTLPWVILIFGILLSSSLFGVMLAIVQTKERAQTLADKMTEELSLSEERLRFVLEGSGDGIWDWNIATNEVFFSKRWKEMLGFADDEIQGSLDEWKNRVHPDDLEQVFEDVKEHFDGKTQVYINEHRVKCKNGSYKWILDRGVVVSRDRYGKPTRMVGSHTDITPQKDAEDELKKINEHLAGLVEKETAKRMEKDRLLIQQSKLATMGEMIGAIGHQWRQPLNSLGLMIQDTVFAHEYGELDKEYLKHFKEESMNTIQSMSKTIDDFKNFFSPNKKEERFFLEDAILQSIKILEAQFKSNSIKIFFDIDLAHKHDYICYKNELNQVILNILANAKDALLEKKPQDPFVKVEVVSVFEGYEITIEDSAGGIAEGIIDKIFDPYFTTKEEGKGTGIGLYMSKDIVVEHLGGKISVKNSENGAKFTIWLPRKEG
jgi:PAS domain S-box-containing protein